ncbi:MAG TPA: hypothetical protein DIC18_02480 [Clostridiales bacterium]|nr:hypothetical protein [Clostridiales bacterium]
MTDNQRGESAENSFAYMEELSKAYTAAFAKRIKNSACPLSEEKKQLLLELQSEIARIATKVTASCRTEEQKELSSMIKESAEEAIGYIWEKQPERPEEETPFLPAALLLSRAVILANRSLNLLIRHTMYDEKLFALFLSELSALYALAAIR